jgi:hypothetical protein
VIKSLVFFHITPIDIINKPKSMQALFSLLQEPQWQEFITHHAQKNSDSLGIVKEFPADWNIELRAAMLEQIELYPKWKKKFPQADFLWTNKLALEQSSAPDIAQWKAGLFPPESRIADLCCGMGADSFALQGHELTGVDLDPERLEMYAHNAKQMGLTAKTLLRDVQEKPVDADYFLLDPARRPGSSNQRWQADDFSPSPSSWAQIIQNYKGGIIKLAPGLDFELDFPHTRVFLGGHRECREQAILCGELHLPQMPKHGGVAAVVLPEAFVYCADKEAAHTQAPLSEVQDFLWEPHAPLLRAHLFNHFGLQYGFQQIHPRIAYMTSADIPSDAQKADYPFRGFRVLEVLQAKTKAIRKAMQEHKITFVEVKKRGMDINPSEWQKKLNKNNKKADTATTSGVLLFSRTSNKHVALLCTRI